MFEERPFARFIPEVTKTKHSTIIRNKFFALKHPKLTGFICFLVFAVIAWITLPLFFTSTTVTVYNPNIESWNKVVPSYTNKLVSDWKSTTQPTVFWGDNGYIVVIDCNYEALSISYQTSGSYTWFMTEGEYRGNDQYYIPAVPVTMDFGTTAKFITYRIELYTDQGVETTFFTTKH